MKKYRFQLLFIAAFLLGFVSCKKEENRVIYQSGTAPVLTSSATNALVFLKDSASNNALTLSWTNPNYMFNTGVSSQNVTYIIEVDTVGANFSSPLKAEIAISSDLSKTFTVQELNTILNSMNLAFAKSHQVELRIKSSLANGAAPQYSNSVKISMTPYLDVAVPLSPTGNLYITGSATAAGWTNSPPASQQFTQNSLTAYSITIALTVGQVKFLSTPGKWQPQYGMVKDKPGVIGANMGTGSDPDAIDITDTGTYKIALNFITGRYTITKQ